MNGRPLDVYFGRDTNACCGARQPLELADALDRFDVYVTVSGGGNNGQAGAIRHGITRALMEYDGELRGSLRRAGHVTVTPAPWSVRRWVCTRRVSVRSSPSAKTAVQRRFTPPKKPGFAEAYLAQIGGLAVCPWGITGCRMWAFFINICAALLRPEARGPTSRYSDHPPERGDLRGELLNEQ